MIPLIYHSQPNHQFKIFIDFPYFTIHFIGSIGVSIFSGGLSTYKPSIQKTVHGKFLPTKSLPASRDLCFVRARWTQPAGPSGGKVVAMVNMAIEIVEVDLPMKNCVFFSIVMLVFIGGRHVF